MGPGFRVTRNKLTFRDNLSLLLESGSPTDRQLEKRFKEWLAKSHKELDRTIKFEAMCSQAVQVCCPAACSVAAAVLWRAPSAVVWTGNCHTVPLG